MAIYDDYTLIQKTRILLGDTAGTVWTDDELTGYLLTTSTDGTLEGANQYDASYTAYIVAAGSAARVSAIHRAAIFQVDLSKVPDALRKQAQEFMEMKARFGGGSPGVTTSPTTEMFPRWNTGDTKTVWDSQ